METPPAVRWVRAPHRMRRHGLRMSRGALLYFPATLLVGLAAVNADINLLIVLFGLCLGVLFVSALSGLRVVRRVTVSRTAPDVAVAGQPFVLRYAVTSRRRWGRCRGLHVVDILPPDAPMPSPEVFVPALRPGETVVLNVPVVCPRRGRLEFGPVAVATRFPFGLFTKYAVRRAPHEIAVFPTLGRLRTPVSVASRVGDAGGGDAASPSRRVGQDEYYGVREYREGDNPRWIHWRRSARTGQLMVREMSQVRAYQFWVAVDTRVAPRDPAAAERLETAISAAATVICDGLERGARVGLICNGRPLLVLPPGGGRAHRPRMLRELALRGPNPDDDLCPHLQRLSWPARWRGACLLFAAADRDDVRDAARALGRVLGPTSVFVAGSSAFHNLFAFDDEFVRGRTGHPRFTKRNGAAVA